MTDAVKRGRRFLLLLLVVAASLLALIIAPFAGGLFTAAVFAAVMHALQRRLTAMLGGRPRLSAAALTLGLTIVVLAPLGWLTAVVARQVAMGVDHVVTTVEEGGVEALVDDLPEGLQPLVRRALSLVPDGVLPQPVDHDAAAAGDEEASPRQQPPADVGALLGGVVRFSRTMLVGLSDLLIDLGVMIVAAFFLLAQGDALARWIAATAPLPDRQIRQFLAEFHDVTVGVFISTVSTAAIQAAVAAIGYLLAGIPWFSVALLATFLAAFVPAIGGATIVVIVGGLLLSTGSTGWGVFLIAWGLVPVALSDNLAKPLLARRRLRLPGAVVFFAMLGGLAMFGPMGVIAGPLIVSFFLVVLRTLASEPGEDPEVAANAA